MSKCVEWLAEVPAGCREQSIIRPAFWNPAAWLFPLSDSPARLPWTGYLSPSLWKGVLPQPCVPALIHPPFQKQDLFQKILVPWNPPNQALKTTSWRDAINLSNPLIIGLQERLSRVHPSLWLHGAHQRLWKGSGSQKNGLFSGHISAFALEVKSSMGSLHVWVCGIQQRSPGLPGGQRSNTMYLAFRSFSHFHLLI